MPLPPPAPPVIATPVAHDVLAPDAEARWVTFELTPGNQIRFSLNIDGRPATAILDTGVSYSVLSRAFAAAAGLKVRDGGSADAIGGGVAIGWVSAQSMVIGALTRTGARFGVAALPVSATGGDRPIDLLLGRDVMAGYALDIDYDARRFRLLPSGRKPFVGLAAPLAISPNQLVYIGEVTLAGRRLRPMLIDTGDGNAVTLSANAWRSVSKGSAVATTTLSYGLGGPIVTDVAIVPEVEVGELTARAVQVQVEPTGGFSAAMGMAGRIGSGFLQRYRVLLDPGAGRMVLSPGKLADLPPLRSTSGLLLAPQGTSLKVVHVMRGGPAEASGWNAGDTICAIDGVAVPTNYAGSAMAHWSVATPGRVVTLTMCDGKLRSLTLRQFY